MSNRLALGTVQFGLPYGISNQSGQVTQEEAKAIVAVARSNNINYIDTAIAYGESENCLGEVGVKDFNIVTKLPPVPNDVKDVHTWVQEQVASSLLRLKVTRVYGLLLHQSKQLIGEKGIELAQALEELKLRGIVKKIGVSIYSPTELEIMTSVCKIDLVQCPFNLIDQRISVSGWLKKLYEADIEVHARSVFLQGLLLLPKNKIPEKFHRWMSLWNKWHDWMIEKDMSAAQACIGFVRLFPQISKIVVGVESVDQLKQLITAAESPMNYQLPDICTTDEMLINPSNWKTL